MADFNWDDHPVATDDTSAQAAAAPSGFNWDDHPVASDVSELSSLGRGLAQGATFGLRDEGAGALASPSGALKEIANKFGAGYSDQDVSDYEKERDASRQLDATAKAANPKSYLGGEIGGGVATSFVPGLGLAGDTSLLGAAGSAAAQGAAYGVGGSESDNIGGLARDAAVGAGTGAAGGAIGHAAGGILANGIDAAGNLISKAAPGLENAADNLAVNATGATGRQSMKFSDDAGRQLLNRGLVRFGDNAKNIGNRIADASDQSGQAIGQALSDLDAKGVKASVENVANSIEGKIKELNQIPGNEKTISQLRNELDNLYDRGQSELPISQGEIAKRNFQAQTNYNSPEAEKAATGQVASSFRNEVERAANAADPNIGAKFQDDKQLFGLLQPIQDAAEKRAATVRQSPIGGLGDMAAAGTGAITGGKAWALPAVIGKKLLAPRIASSLAVTSDLLSKVAAQAPEALGKFAPVIQSATQRGSQAVAATHFILEQSNPEYRQYISKLNGTDTTQ